MRKKQTNMDADQEAVAKEISVDAKTTVLIKIGWKFQVKQKTNTQNSPEALLPMRKVVPL